MNSDTIICYRSDYPTNHPFQTALLSTVSTTEAAFAYATTTGPVVITPTPQTAVLGSFAPLDPNSNNTFSRDSLGMLNGSLAQAQGRPFFNSSSFDGKSFRLRMLGKTHIVTAAGGATTVAPKIALGTSATFASDTLVFAGTALSVPASHTADLTWMLETTLLWDSTAQILTGEGWSNTACWDTTAAAVIAAVYTSRATAAITAQTTPYTALSFIPFIKLTTTAPTSSANTLVEFSMERV